MVRKVEREELNLGLTAGKHYLTGFIPGLANNLFGLFEAKTLSAYFLD